LKNLAGLDGVADTLEELWCSYNNIGKLSGIEKLTNLRVLYMSNNPIKEWGEIDKLAGLPNLEDVLLVNTALNLQVCEESDSATWRLELLKRLPNLKKIDGLDVSDAERGAAAA